MPHQAKEGSPNAPQASKKRKNPLQSSTSSQTNTSRTQPTKRLKIQGARTILTQTSDAALRNGELDVQSFLRSREFEIKALENGMQKSKSIRASRAFQQVPRDMRRRTASHNVKRVPKRLQRRAAREMKEDNTPTVSANKRKPATSRGRIRAETAKRLGILAAKKEEERSRVSGHAKAPNGIVTRSPEPKRRMDRVKDPPKPKSKFRKRQIHKTWLPTHLWHAKRAKMTEPKKPLWRFAIPVTPTQKSYRPTHRAGGASGAVVWDMSYMSTIGLEGPESGLEWVLSAIGVTEPGLWCKKGDKWRNGKRSWTGWLSRVAKGQHLPIAPSTIIWCAADQAGSDVLTSDKHPIRRLFIRVHPAAFLETWTEINRLAKLQRPVVHIEDLRFEIGSIDITGPGSTEALLGILYPYPTNDNEKHAEVFRSLAGVTNPSSLPVDALLNFSILDPRLRYPPRPVTIPKPTDEVANYELLQLLSSWPADKESPSSAIFDRQYRLKAGRLPSQKSLNRRKALASPGSYAPKVATDPPIPIMLLTSRIVPGASMQGTWTLIAPWKCILSIWHGLMHFPLSSGGNPRFGGLDELRQMYFEHGVPWFPADYLGTTSGFAWETDERLRRKAEWDRKPKGKRVEWASLDLGADRKGEIGHGWSCDFEHVTRVTAAPIDADQSIATTKINHNKPAEPDAASHTPLRHLPVNEFTPLLSAIPEDSPSSMIVATIQVTFVSRGVANPCARIYRLPPPATSQDSPSRLVTPASREQWISQLPPTGNNKRILGLQSKTAKNATRIPLNVPLPRRIRLLAQSLVQNPPLPYPPTNAQKNDHPLVPDEVDLIGFITTGSFNLAEGKGVAIGTVIVARVLEGLGRDGNKGGREGRLCIVRNAGEAIGRLARWVPI